MLLLKYCMVRIGNVLKLFTFYHELIETNAKSSSLRKKIGRAVNRSISDRMFIPGNNEQTLKLSLNDSFRLEQEEILET